MCRWAGPGVTIVGSVNSQVGIKFDRYGGGNNERQGGSRVKMGTDEQQDGPKQKGRQYCIVHGCKNEFYGVKGSGKTVHFHTLPLKRKTILRRWLAALNRHRPPANIESRICSEHFLEEDYVEKTSFESGRLVTHRTNKLKPDVVPSVFGSPTFELTPDRRRDAAGEQPTQTDGGHLTPPPCQQDISAVIPQSKPSSTVMDSEATPQPVMCEVCGTYFETRKGLSSHARLHLRQLGVTLSESSGAPIDLLYQLIRDRDGSLPDLNAASSAAGPSSLKKASQQEASTSLEPEDSASYKAGGKALTSSQKVDYQGSPSRPKESAVSFPPSSPSGVRLVESRTSDNHPTPTKPLWAPLETDAPITLDTNDEVHVCQLCGCWYETRRGLSSHARAHLRQIGIPDGEIKGSPIDHLYQIMQDEDLKPIGNKQPEELPAKSPPGSSSKRPFGLSSSPASTPSKRSKTSTDCSCILCGEEFENRKGLASHARSHLNHLGVTDLLGKTSAIETVQELVSSGMLEAVHPSKPKCTSGAPAGPPPATRALSPAPNQSWTSFPSTSVNPSPAKSTPPPPGSKAPKAKKGFRLAVDPLQRKPKPEPEEVEVTVPDKRSGTNNNSPVQQSPPAAAALKPAGADVQSPPTVLCDYCGQLFDTRKALSCHARAHLRQLGLTWSIKTSPIDLLKEVMSQGADGRKESGSLRQTTWTPQSSRRAPESQSLDANPAPCTSPLDYSMKEKPTAAKSGASHGDTSCELCGFDFENRKALASHARAHLRQLGIVEWKADGATSPIELLSELIRKDPVKVAAITQRYRTGDLYIKKRAAASPSLSTDSDSVSIGSLKHSEHKIRREGLGPALFRQSHGHSRTAATHAEPHVRSPKGVHPPKHAVPSRQENQDSSYQQPSRSGSIPAMLPKPPLTPLVKLVGKIYSLKCRFCEEEFHGPLSVQERWIRHLQKHIMSLGYKGKASPPATPVAAPALVHPVAV